MVKTKEELTKLKKEYEQLSEKLEKLTEEELKQVVGGEGGIGMSVRDGYCDGFHSPSEFEELGVQKDKTKETIETKDVSITERIESPIDYSQPEKWVPLFDINNRNMR